MQAILCDVCERRIDADAFEIHMINGFAVKTEAGTRLSQRRGSRQVYLCGSCGRWLDQAIDHLRSSYRAMRDAEHLLHPGLRLGE